MSRSDQGYRRFRTRGGESDDGDGLDELRALTAREAGSAEPPPGPRRAQRPLTPPRPSRADRREAARRDRRWWSLRGLGPAGWIGRMALLLVAVVAVWAVAGFLVLNGAVSEANSRIAPAAHRALDPAPGGMLGTPTNTLILGVDARRGQTRSRADTILVMRTDPDAGRLKYLSIPRDFRVEIPGQGTQKINAAFYFGGQAGAIRAVKRLTGIPIHHVIVIRFNGVAQVVDALGGVTLDNPTALNDCYYEAGRRVTFPRGPIELDGDRALEFSRVRSCDGDLQRALRQQLVVSAMKDRVLSPSQLWRAPWQGADVVRALQTDIGTFDMVKMGWLQARLTSTDADRTILSGEPLMIDGVSFIVGTDPDRNEREIAAFMGSS
jgi:polyisoprenyl-teichoic acid--peptidoglycan teichoic acid transferase